MLRALILLVVLTAQPAVAAASSLLHLCMGKVTLTGTCCCDHDEAGPSGNEATASATPADRCCPVLSRASGSSSQPGTTARTATPVFAAVLPPAPSAPVVALELTPPAWVLTPGLHRATAPPLYIRDRAFIS